MLFQIQISICLKINNFLKIVLMVTLILYALVRGRPGFASSPSHFITSISLQKIMDDEENKYRITRPSFPSNLCLSGEKGTDKQPADNGLRGESGVFSTGFQSQFTQCSQILTGLYHIPYYSPYWALSEKAQNFDMVAMVTTYSLWLAEILNDRNY